MRVLLLVPEGGKQCVWSLTCPGSDGKDVGFSGVGLEIKPEDDDAPGRPPRLDHIAFDGSAEGFAARMLEHARRRVDVPKHLVGRRIQIEVEGDFDDAIRAAGFDQAAKAIEFAIDAALQSADTRTPDLRGKLGTKAFGKHIAAAIG